MNDELFPKPPKPPKRMKQPPKDHFRWRAELAEAQLAFIRTPVWWRLWHRIASRIRRSAP